MEEEEEEIKPSRVGEKMEREALMVRRSLREEGSFILVDIHGHGRSWLLGGAAARGGGQGESVREWRVRKMSKGEVEWPANLLIKREDGGCLLL
jgi:hypothetical protein